MNILSWVIIVAYMLMMYSGTRNKGRLTKNEVSSYYVTMIILTLPVIQSVLLLAGF